MEIATDEDRTVSRERARVIGSQSLSMYRSLSLLLARSCAVSHLLACARSLVCVMLGSASSTPARQHGKIWHHLSSMNLFSFSGFFFFLKKTKEEGGRSQRIKVCRKSMWYASDKETLKENGNQYAGGVGLVAFAFQFAIQLLEEIFSVFVFVVQHISIRLIFPV